MSQRVFAIAAHPDDIEFLMAGTLLHLASRGFEIHYMTIANGCCGSMEYDRAETARIRKAESQTAAKRLGAVYHSPLCDDLAIFYDSSTLSRLTAVMREVAPTIVLTHSPSDYMEDHTTTCRLAVTAAFARGMPNFRSTPELPPTSIAVALYHAQPYSNHTPLGEPVIPSLYVDTTTVIEEKVELLACHASQKQWLDLTQGQDSYLETLRSLDRQVGSWSKRFTYAEGWRQHAAMGFGPNGWNPLSESLGDSICLG